MGSSGTPKIVNNPRQLSILHFFNTFLECNQVSQTGHPHLAAVIQALAGW
jgi:hypothetical protein